MRERAAPVVTAPRGVRGGAGAGSAGDGDAAGLGLLGLGEPHLEDTVHQAGGDVLAVEVLRVAQREAAEVVAHVVLGVGGRESLILLRGDAPLEAQHAVVQLDLDVVLLDARHVDEEPQRVLVLADVDVGQVGPARTGVLLLLQLLLLLGSKILCGHRSCPPYAAWTVICRGLAAWARGIRRVITPCWKRASACSTSRSAGRWMARENRPQGRSRRW